MEQMTLEQKQAVAMANARLRLQQPVSPEPTSEPSMMSRFNPMNNPLVRGAYGLAEGGSNMLTGMGGMALGGLRGLGSLASGEGVEKATQKIQGLSDSVTYEPRTAEGAVTAKALALPMEYASKLGGFMGRNSGIAELTGTQDAMESVGEVAPQIAGTLLGGRSALRGARTAAESSAASTLAENIRKSELDAPRIEAAQLANKYNIAVNPAQSNPSLMNTLRAKVAGKEKMAKELHDKNQYRPVEIIKDELGIERAQQIDAAALDKIRAEAAKPKEAIKKIAKFTDDGTTASAVNALKQDTMIGGKGVARKLNTLITDAENFIAKNPNGTQIMAEIDLLRETARNIKKKDSPKKKELAEARTSLGIANALEAMIERNLEKSGNVDLLNQYRDGRKLSAKTFVAEDVIDFNTGKVKVSELAKMTSGDTALTGAMADLGKIYGNFPESMRLKEGGFGLADASELSQTHLLRTSVPGTLGAIAGLPFGSPILGAATGAALGEVVGSRYAKRMVSPEFQKANAIPTDFRPKDIPLSDPPLSLAPVGTPLGVPSESMPVPQGRGLLNLADDGTTTAKSEIQIPGIEMPLDPRLRGMYEGKSISPASKAQFNVHGTPDEIGIVPKEAYPPNLKMPEVQFNAPQERGLLSLEDPATVRVTGKREGLLDTNRNEIDFKLRQQILKDYEPQITAFREEAARLETIANNKYPITGKPQAEARMQLEQLQQEFAAGMRQLGVDTPQEAIGLQPLFQSGNTTKLPIVKSRGLLDYSKE